MSLIATDGLESALREILSTLHRQAADIANLKSEVAQCVTRADIVSIDQSLQAKLNSFEQQLNSLQQETAVDLPLDGLDYYIEEASADTALARSRDVAATRVPIARFVAAHHSHLRRLNNANAVAATRAMLDDLHADTQASLRAALEQVGDERAARATVDQLSATADALAAQLSAMQGMLHTKVDRAEVVKLQATAAELGTFSTWKSQTSHSVSDLEVRLGSTRSALDKGLESVVKLSGTVQALASTAGSKADSKDVSALQLAQNRLASDVSTRALTSDLRETQSNVASVGGRVSTVEGGLKEFIRQAAEDKRAGEGRLAASAATLRHEISTLSETLQREVSRLADEVDARAYVTAVEATDETVSTVRGTVEVLDRKVGVALRFIDWYAEKGELYEANASAVERQLNSLAVGNRAGATFGSSRGSTGIGATGGMRSRVFGQDVPPATQAAYSPMGKAAESLLASAIGGSPGPAGS